MYNRYSSDGKDPDQLGKLLLQMCNSTRMFISLWHRRFGHLSKAGITHLSRAGYILKLSFSDHQFCERCQYGKQVAASHPTSAPRESSPLDLVHSDVCGPMPHQSLGVLLRLDSEGVGLPHQNQRSCVLDLLQLARNGRKPDRSETEMSLNRQWRLV